MRHDSRPIFMWCHRQCQSRPCHRRHQCHCHLRRFDYLTFRLMRLCVCVCACVCVCVFVCGCVCVCVCVSVSVSSDNEEAPATKSRRTTTAKKLIFLLCHKSACGSWSSMLKRGRSCERGSRVGCLVSFLCCRSSSLSWSCVLSGGAGGGCGFQIQNIAGSSSRSTVHKSI